MSDMRIGNGDSDPKSVIKGLILGRMRVVREAMIGQQVTVPMLHSIKSSLYEYLREIQATEGVDLRLDQYEVVVVFSYDRVLLDVVQTEAAQAMRAVTSGYRYERVVV